MQGSLVGTSLPLMIEVYKFFHGLSPPIMNDIFTIRENAYNLHNFRPFTTENIRTSLYGSESITYKASQLWRLVPSDIKNLGSLLLFKHAIRSWACENCPCRLCKNYIPQLGYI